MENPPSYEGGFSMETMYDRYDSFMYSGMKFCSGFCARPAMPLTLIALRFFAYSMVGSACGWNRTGNCFAVYSAKAFRLAVPKVVALMSAVSVALV